jgi:RNA polymerase sigma factor (sigma-70 family)
MHQQGRSTKPTRGLSGELSVRASTQESADTTGAALKEISTKAVHDSTDDVMQTYLREIGQYPRLSHLEEITLGSEKRRAKVKALRLLTGSDLVAAKLLALIDRIQLTNKGLSKVFDVAQTDVERRGNLLRLLSVNSTKIRSVLAENRKAFTDRLSRSVQKDERAPEHAGRRRHKLASLLTELGFRQVGIAKLKHDLFLFALETRLLNIRLKLATLGQNNQAVTNSITPRVPNSVERRPQAREELYSEYVAMREQITKERKLEDANLLTRTPEELRALSALVKRREESVDPRLRETLPADRLTSIIAAEKLVKTALEKRRGFDGCKNQYDTTEEFERARDRLIQAIRHLGIKRQALQEQELAGASPEEISAMKCALWERLLALGESPKAALQRIARCDEYLKQQNAAIKALVNSNLRLVISIARQRTGRGVELPDLIQHGNQGLIIAAEKFDHSRGFRFGTYAHWWIQQLVSQAVWDHSSTIRLSSSARKAVYELNKLERQLTHKLGQHPSREELFVAYAKQQDSKPGRKDRQRPPLSRQQRNYRREFDLLSRVALGIVSLDHPSTSQHSGDLSTLVTESTQDTTSAADYDSVRDSLLEAMRVLEPREKLVVIARFGLGDDPSPETLRSLGFRLQITQERVRQIEAKALEKMRVRLLKYRDNSD